MSLLNNRKSNVFDVTQNVMLMITNTVRKAFYTKLNVANDLAQMSEAVFWQERLLRLLLTSSVHNFNLQSGFPSFFCVRKERLIQLLDYLSVASPESGLIWLVKKQKVLKTKSWLTSSQRNPESWWILSQHPTSCWIISRHLKVIQYTSKDLNSISCIYVDFVRVIRFAEFKNKLKS